ncbi:putative colanic acid biosysnthesis UDP-glucose lipid carrier transferase [Prevotella sp. ne3005]|uniref:exopolysaccharide biosynthesis polyprenyl glycosylphosphotransferase n=1 Tax=Prevotella sp. ne3005 TaxID=1761887 RepID=UPI0008C04850|nr:exopolysaccharide biosynthesis polyprenyl glycosylphosphotransferase [Prevotella sp. ne3005]SEM54030.1 putative colanic acid biosysnthesis UDP-glucose lipid carrier transferase [Prevotella sp. ne3005]
MSSNNQSNNLIKWMIIIGDLIIMNILLLAFTNWHPQAETWSRSCKIMVILVCNLTLVMSEFKFYTVIHRRLVSSADILRRIVWLTVVQAVLAYLFLKVLDYMLPVGWFLFALGTTFFLVLSFVRLFERWLVKLYRKAGGNFRTVTLIGSDTELLNVYDRLMKDPTRGYKVYGYYGDEIDGAEGIMKRLGSLEDVTDNLNTPENLKLGDDVYVCLSRRQPEIVKRISRMCDAKVNRFFYVPVSVESMGISLKRELLDDMEVYTTYENPLQNPVNKLEKRLFDIVFSIGALLCILPFLPIIALIIKIQSPKGPVFFKQPRTGLDGKNFYCYKFRSMHPNKDESGAKQATKDDPRKFPFGNFMRKASVDELPQFWNVLKGDMSVVGPRPHPIVINEKYTELIDKYMARHFVKPGLTGWAQVTGFRGETEELWQMEGRVKKDIWYMEHWDFWLDIRILWMTVKQIVTHDEQAY